MIDKDKIKENVLLKPLMPFKDIIWFLILFVSFELIWKLCVHIGEDESILLVFGKDLTAYTKGFCLWTAKSVYWLVHDVLNYYDFQRSGVYLYFENSLRVDIIWGCTGLKQYIMFFFILLFYFGPVKKKLWYLPMSILILAIINILRLAIICIIIKDPFPAWFIPVNEWYNNRVWENTQEVYWQFYTDWFHVFHKDIFTWVYYDGVIFLLWLIWEERVNKPYQRLKNRLNIK